MARARHRVAAIKIEILVPLVRVDPDALATFGNERHLLVRR